MVNAASLGAHFGNGQVEVGEVAAGILGAVIRDPGRDTAPWREYLELVVRERPGWGDLYLACRELDR